MSFGPVLVRGVHKVSRFLQVPCTAGAREDPAGRRGGRATCFGSPALLPGLLLALRLFVELFPRLWPEARDSQGRSGCFPPADLVCRRVCGQCAGAHFVLEKSRLVGRKGRGRGVVVEGWGGWPQPPEEMKEWGRAPDVGRWPASGCLVFPSTPHSQLCSPGTWAQEMAFLLVSTVVFGLWTSKQPELFLQRHCWVQIPPKAQGSR